MKRIRWLFFSTLLSLLMPWLCRAQTPINGIVTISVTNSPANITVDRTSYFVAVRENAASPTAVFSITLTGTSVAQNFPAGAVFVFNAPNGQPFQKNQTIGTIVATTSGPFTFTATESTSAQPSMQAKIGSASGGGGGSGTVTSVATTSPVTGGPITGSGTIACATCAIGPGSSTANHIAEFASTDGLTLKDGGAASNGISGQASGVIPLGSTATTIGAQSHCDDGVTTSATVTCTEPITSSGAGTFGGSGPSTFSAGIQIEGGSTLATSNQTGTGNIVLATSPTLVTPALGTPSSATLTNATGLPYGAGITGKYGQCTELWGGSGTSFALTSGDDAIADNGCYNDSGVTRTITAVKARSDNGSNTTTVNPTFGAEGTGTTICSGALTAGSSLAYSSTCTVSNASWTTGTGINPVMGGTLTGTSIALLIEYTF